VLRAIAEKLSEGAAVQRRRTASRWNGSLQETVVIQSNLAVRVMVPVTMVMAPMMPRSACRAGNSRKRDQRQNQREYLGTPGLHKTSLSSQDALYITPEKQKSSARR
jgi:hypothetical protein